MDHAIIQLEDLLKSSTNNDIQLLKMPSEYLSNVDGYSRTSDATALEKFQIIPDETYFADFFNKGIATNISHDQKITNLCAPFTAVTVMRAELKRTVRNKLREIKDKSDRDFQEIELARMLSSAKCGHRRMLTNFLFCSYPRSMDGLALNKGMINVAAQFGQMEDAVNRMAYPTFFLDAGWKMIPAVHDIAKAFELNIQDMRMNLEQVIHPRSPGRGQLKTFDDAIANNFAVCSAVYSEFYDGSFAFGHAMPLVAIASGEYIFKDSDGHTDNRPGISVNRESFQAIMDSGSPPSDAHSDYIDETSYDESSVATKFVHDVGYIFKLGNYS